MSELIKSRGDLISYLTTKKIASRNEPESVMISAKVRREILTGEDQGSFIHKGVVKMFEFKSIGGGVYEVRIATRKDKS